MPKVRLRPVDWYNSPPDATHARRRGELTLWVKDIVPGVGCKIMVTRDDLQGEWKDWYGDTGAKAYKGKYETRPEYLPPKRPRGRPSTGALECKTMRVPIVLEQQVKDLIAGYRPS